MKFKVTVICMGEMSCTCSPLGLLNLMHVCDLTSAAETDLKFQAMTLVSLTPCW